MVKAGNTVVEECLAAALRDLMEFGWVDLSSRGLAERIAGEVRRRGVPARIVPLAHHWYRVETPSGSARRGAWVAVRAVGRPGGGGGEPRPAGLGTQATGPSDGVAEHLVIVDMGVVVHIFTFPPDGLEAARAFARAVEEQGVWEPDRLVELAVRLGGGRR